MGTARCHLAAAAIKSIATQTTACNHLAIATQSSGLECATKVSRMPRTQGCDLNNWTLHSRKQIVPARQGSKVLTLACGRPMKQYRCGPSSPLALNPAPPFALLLYKSAPPYRSGGPPSEL